VLTCACPLEFLTKNIAMIRPDGRVGNLNPAKRIVKKYKAEVRELQKKGTK